MTASITPMILAGGLGTRVSHLLPGISKVVAPIDGQPFLTILLRQIQDAGFLETIICTGVHAESIVDALGANWGHLHVRYSRESEPLGTGGAIRLGMERSPAKTFLVMNGDSFVDAPLRDFVLWFTAGNYPAALLTTEVPDVARFGQVLVGADHRVLEFREKGAHQGPGQINAGVYLLRREIFSGIPPGAFSLERDLFPGLCGSSLFAFQTRAPFIDIGTPESLAQASHFLKRMRTD